MKVNDDNLSFLDLIRALDGVVSALDGVVSALDGAVSHSIARDCPVHLIS